MVNYRLVIKKLKKKAHDFLKKVMICVRDIFVRMIRIVKNKEWKVFE